MLRGFSVESFKNLWLGSFLNPKLNTRLPRKKIWKLDVNALVRKENDFSLKFTLLSLAETPVDQYHMCAPINTSKM